nr:hypothetical protein [Shuttle vector pI3]
MAAPTARTHSPPPWLPLAGLWSRVAPVALTTPPPLLPPPPCSAYTPTPPACACFVPLVTRPPTSPPVPGRSSTPPPPSPCFPRPGRSAPARRWPCGWPSRAACPCFSLAPLRPPRPAPGRPPPLQAFPAGSGRRRPCPACSSFPAPSARLSFL